MTKLPLSDLVVLEFAGLAPVPLAGLMLADYGATVLRIDRISSASALMTADPLGLAASANRKIHRRGKRSIAIDVKSVQGRDLVLDLYEIADVVLDPFRPGVLESLGLGPMHARRKVAAPTPASLSTAATKSASARKNPHPLIFCRVTGYGQTGPLRLAAGHDINYAALSGVLAQLVDRSVDYGVEKSSGNCITHGRLVSSTSSASPCAAVVKHDLRPRPPVNLLADFAGGSFLAVVGVLLRLIQRQRADADHQRVEDNPGSPRSARNRVVEIVDISMTEGLAYLASFLQQARRLDNGMLSQHKASNQSVDDLGLLDGAAPFYRCYGTKDGRFLSVGALEPQFFRSLVSALEREKGLLTKEEGAFLTASQYDKRCWTEIGRILTRVFGSRTFAQWEAFSNSSGDACVMPVYSFAESQQHKHMRARGAWNANGLAAPHPAPGERRADNSSGGENSPGAGRRKGESPGRPAPEEFTSPADELVVPGQHSAEILRDYLGMSEDQVSELLDGGVVGRALVQSSDVDVVKQRSKL